MVQDIRKPPRRPPPQNDGGEPAREADSGQTPSRAVRLRQRLVLLAVCLVLAAGLAWLSMRQSGPKPDVPMGPVAIGGPFHMVDQTGRAVDQSLLQGKWSAVFFGYTFCPDVCPTTLTALGGATQRLGDKAKRLQVVFVTIDPARDTPAQLKTYLQSPVFPPGAVGLTGAPDQVAAIAKAYKVYYAKSGTGPGYLMDHSSIIYLMDPKGGFVRLMRPDQGPDAMAKAISQAMG